MLSVVLVASGLIVTVYGTWRGYVAARGAMLPLVQQGDPTRSLVEATRPVHERSRVRMVARQVLLAVGWLSVALYGMYLATVGSAVGA
ncbi:MAG TPA: hypothetical protein VFY23_01290 [Candidatus Limnocylindrales bacterium]|nr:hypothetical protein [Candidatus Limnocylindrales bacterium]